MLVSSRVTADPAGGGGRGLPRSSPVECDRACHGYKLDYSTLDVSQPRQPAGPGPHPAVTFSPWHSDVITPPSSVVVNLMIRRFENSEVPRFLETQLALLCGTPGGALVVCIGWGTPKFFFNGPGSNT